MRKRTILLNLTLLSFIIISFSSPIHFTPTVSSITSWGSTYDDTEWEGAGNDLVTTATQLNESTSNTNPLNASTWSPDVYNITVPGKFFLTIKLNFVKSFVYNTTGHLINHTADLDVQLNDSSGNILRTSNGSSEVEVIGPYFASQTENLTIKVFTHTYEFKENIPYSTLYNMTVIIDDFYEAIEHNDQISALNPYDDELVPGFYPNLYVSNASKLDYYLAYLMENTSLDFTLNYTDQGIPLLMNLLAPNSTDTNHTVLVSGTTSSGLTQISSVINETGFYYLLVNGSDGFVGHYSLDFDIVDIYDSTASNDLIGDATFMTPGIYTGLTTSENDLDWFSFDVEQRQRVLVTVSYFSEIDGLEMSLFEGLNANTTIIDPVKIGNSFRCGPHLAAQSKRYYLLVNSTNEYPAYYILNIQVAGPDDLYEENDAFNDAALLPSNEFTEYKPTTKDPFGGLIFLEDDDDYYAFVLLPGDELKVEITFNGSDANLNLEILNGSRYVLSESLTPFSNNETVEAVAQRSELFVVHVFGDILDVDETIALYNMTVWIEKADDVFEANDNRQSAKPIAEGNYNNLISRIGNDDWYAMYLNTNDDVSISLNYEAEIQEENIPNDIDVDFLYPNGSLAMKSHTLDNESVVFQASESGMYYLDAVLITGYSNTYSLAIEVNETDDSYEDNDVFTEAMNLTFSGDPTSGVVTNNYENFRIRVKDDDYYRVIVPAGIAIGVSVSVDTGKDLDLEVFKANGELLGSSKNPSGVSETVDPVRTEQGEDFVYIRVFMDTGDVANYDIEIKLGPEEFLVPISTVPPFTEKTKPTTTKKRVDPFAPLVPIAVGGALLGGGAAAGIYGVKKTGALDKGTKFVKDRFGRKPPKTPPPGVKKPPKAAMKAPPKAAPKGLPKTPPKTPPKVGPKAAVKGPPKVGPKAPPKSPPKVGPKAAVKGPPKPKVTPKVDPKKKLKKSDDKYRL